MSWCRDDTAQHSRWHSTFWTSFTWRNEAMIHHNFHAFSRTFLCHFSLTHWCIFGEQGSRKSMSMLIPMSMSMSMSRWDDSALFFRNDSTLFNTFYDNAITRWSELWRLICHYLKLHDRRFFWHEMIANDERITVWCPASGSMVWIDQNWFYKIHLFFGVRCLLFPFDSFSKNFLHASAVGRSWNRMAAQTKGKQANWKELNF